MNKAFELLLTNDDLDNVTEYQIKPPFILEYFKEGYGKYWKNIHLLSDKYNRISDETFETQFELFHEELHQRQLYIRAGNEIVGTCTAWNDLNGKYKDYGKIHWLAVIPDFQGQGLGKVLLSQTIRILKTLGYNKAYLETDSRRKNALFLYEKMGFIKQC